MSAFMQELLEIALEVMPEADNHEILPPPKRAMRLSWKTNDDPDRKNKRFQPVIIELNEFFMQGDLPEHVPTKLREEFAAFVSHKLQQFNPRTTDSPHQSHTADHWIFPPRG